MRILLTGFEPFGGESENAAEQAVRGVAESYHRAGVEVVTRILPVVFAAAGPALAAALAEVGADAVLAVGEAGGRDAVTPERYARNRIEARIPDNAGDRPTDRPVVGGAPQRLPNAFDVDEQVRRLTAAGIPARVSDDAGAFVCNQVAYLVAHGPVPGGFVHVPAVRTTSPHARVGDETDPGGGPTEARLGPDDLVAALRVVLDAVVDDPACRPADGTGNAVSGAGRPAAH